MAFKTLVSSVFHYGLEMSLRFVGHKLCDAIKNYIEIQKGETPHEETYVFIEELHECINECFNAEKSYASLAEDTTLSDNHREHYSACSKWTGAMFQHLMILYHNKCGLLQLEDEHFHLPSVEENANYKDFAAIQQFHDKLDKTVNNLRTDHKFDSMNENLLELIAHSLVESQEALQSIAADIGNDNNITECTKKIKKVTKLLNNTLLKLANQLDDEEDKMKPIEEKVQHHNEEHKNRSSRIKNKNATKHEHESTVVDECLQSDESNTVKNIPVSKLKNHSDADKNPYCEKKPE